MGRKEMFSLLERGRIFSPPNATGTVNGADGTAGIAVPPAMCHALRHIAVAVGVAGNGRNGHGGGQGHLVVTVDGRPAPGGR